MAGIVIETAEGPTVELREAPAGALLLIVEQVPEFGPRQRIAVVIRPDRVKDVVRYCATHLAELEAARWHA